ncbi:glycosyltransferase family 2 protein [Tropicimonas marinistellae]|uniref:glycosyltransferase family 2 protein n=1 Tax=Tropicimonas marinistellae TaxID=1739787 RepID=UPI000831489C|nr:glycosyltransferase family 2 protein [Tropicimonas marinistellae]
MSTHATVSVIIPAYKAQAQIGRAVASVADAGLSASDVEIVIASDDGTDYRSCLPSQPNLRFSAPGPVASGPGAARNRALTCARGRWAAFLDADDTWEPGYLSVLLPLAQAYGVAFGATSVLEGETELLRMPGGDRLTLEDVGRSGASFHPVMPRSQAGPFASAPAQDVLHAVEALSLCGGEAPVGSAAYQLRLRTGSVTRDTGFSDRVAAAYSLYASRIQAGRTRVPAALVARAIGVFEARRALNTAFQCQERETSFYRYVAARGAAG